MRHNEEHVNAALAAQLPWHVDERALDSPHVKAALLLQAHFAQVLPEGYPSWFTRRARVNPLGLGSTPTILPLFFAGSRQGGAAE